MPLPQRDITPIASSYEAITIDDTAGGVALTPPDAARYAFWRLETADIRVTTDGTAPTTTAGILIHNDETGWLTEPEEVRRFLAIRTTATSGSLRVIYYQ